MQLTTNNLRENKMRDADWRPSPCPDCGKYREAQEKPVCDNKDCKANKKE